MSHFALPKGLVLKSGVIQTITGHDTETYRHIDVLGQSWMDNLLSVHVHVRCDRVHYSLVPNFLTLKIRPNPLYKIQTCS